MAGRPWPIFLLIGDADFGLLESILLPKGIIFSPVRQSLNVVKKTGFDHKTRLCYKKNLLRINKGANSFYS